MAFERPDKRTAAAIHGASESPPPFGKDDGITATGVSAMLAIVVRGSSLRPAVTGDVADGGTRAIFSAISRSNFAISRRKKIHTGHARQRRVRVQIHSRDRMSATDKSVFRPEPTRGRRRRRASWLHVGRQLL